MPVLSFGRILAALVLGALLLPSTLRGQQFPGLGGVGVRAAAVTPEQAKTGFGVSADLDLGSLRLPWLRTLLGFNYFTADVDRRVAGTPVGGSMTAMSGRVGIRADMFAGARFSPYVGAALGGHSVNASVADPGTQDLLDGFYMGAGVSGGFAFALDSARRFSVVGEVRRAFVTNVGHTAYELGFRFSPRGALMYSDIAANERRLAREEQARLAREREEARLAIERANVQRDSLAAAQERRDAERLRTEQQRQEAERLTREREDADRLERERIERERASQAQRDRDAVRQQQQVQSQAEIDRLRRQADSLRAAQSAEARARSAAEAAADSARARAVAADSAARAANARAGEAERRRYEALLDLDRLITTVTEIRDTPRGLVIVLGEGLFASGQFTLSPRARSEIEAIAAVLAQYEDNRIAVEGHTDSVGSEVANQRLSERRAETVRAALIGRGVAPSRIEMAGFGQGVPVADNATAEGRARNRRVEITIIGGRRPGSG